MKLSIGFSPCPNDTFIFDALVNGSIDTGDVEFDVVLEDVQTLNQWASEGRLDVTKLSFPALFATLDTYQLLNTGAALGKGVGPLLVAKEPIDPSEVPLRTIAIPGENTTANFLLSYALPSAQRRIPMLFSEIEDAVLNGEVDMGVIIHENRFTYYKRGLVKLADLGEVWENREQAPIPLGCIAVKRKLPKELQLMIGRMISESIRQAWLHYPAIPGYVKKHAQAMDEDVMRQHIELYVNDYTSDLGASGKAAVQKLYEVYCHSKKDSASRDGISFLF